MRGQLPAAPARVIDVGCGPRGGFVPFLRDEGYDALGVDPKAPDESGYLQEKFEDADVAREVDAVIACTSLHHVTQPENVVGRIAGVLASGGTVIVVEWAWEDFDTPTAEWAFERLRTSDDPSWLERRRDGWRESRADWEGYLHAWAEEHGLHPATKLVPLLDAQFERRRLARGPFLFVDLADTSEADEQAAIDAGRVRPLRIDYVGMRG